MTADPLYLPDFSRDEARNAILAAAAELGVAVSRVEITRHEAERTEFSPSPSAGALPALATSWTIASEVCGPNAFGARACRAVRSSGVLLRQAVENLRGELGNWGRP